MARQSVGQIRERQTGTADGGEILPPLGLLPGNWGGRLDMWRPSWVGSHPGIGLLIGGRLVRLLGEQLVNYSKYSSKVFTFFFVYKQF